MRGRSDIHTIKCFPAVNMSSLLFRWVVTLRSACCLWPRGNGVSFRSGERRAHDTRLRAISFAASLGGLSAAPFDLRQLKLSAPPVPIVRSVSMDPGIGTVDYALSANGTLVYVPERATNRVVWVDRAGGTKPLLDASKLDQNRKRRDLHRDRSARDRVAGPR